MFGRLTLFIFTLSLAGASALGQPAPRWAVPEGCSRDRGRSPVNNFANPHGQKELGERSGQQERQAIELKERKRQSAEYPCSSYDRTGDEWEARSDSVEETEDFRLCRRLEQEKCLKEQIAEREPARDRPSKGAGGLVGWRQPEGSYRTDRGAKRDQNTEPLFAVSSACGSSHSVHPCDAR